MNPVPNQNMPQRGVLCLTIVRYLEEDSDGIMTHQVHFNRQVV